MKEEVVAAYNELCQEVGAVAMSGNVSKLRRILVECEITHDTNSYGLAWRLAKPTLRQCSERKRLSFVYVQSTASLLTMSLRTKISLTVVPHLSSDHCMVFMKT